MATDRGRCTGAQALPLGRRAPRGAERWYLVACPEGRERATCERVRAIVPPGVLADAFVPRVERVKKVRGEWTVVTRDLFEGYFVAVSADAPALARALVGLSFPAALVGPVGRGYAPVDEDAQAFLVRSMDATHTIRRSEGEIVGESLRVTWGPLAGQEARVARVNRKKALATVRVGGAGSSSSLLLPLAIPVRS